MRRIINLLLWIIIIILLGWFFLSYVDVITHNLDKVPQYANWNIFEIFF